MKRSSLLLLVALSAASVGEPVRGADTLFLRGDSNLDGTRDISDAAHTLGFLFLGSPDAIGCEDAADSNDDGSVDIGDPVHSLGFLFLGIAPPPPPFAGCGPDPSEDALGCEAFPGCELGEGRFGEAVSYRACCAATAVALADLDGDHALDLAVANWGGGRNSPVSILLGAGDGTFAEAVNYRACFRPEGVVAGDLDADGALDLALASPQASDVSVLLGAGDGSFGEAVSYPTDYLPFSVALGDLDRDGALDLAAANLSGGGVSVLLGAGDGTFGEAVHYPGGRGAFSLVPGDLDRDGTLDLAVTEVGTDFLAAGRVWILLGVGDGSFGEAVGHAAGVGPRSVALGDLDRDGALDLAVANDGSNDASILLGTGDGTFGGAVSCPAGAGPLSVAIGDLDRDGALDLAVANSGSDDVSILPGLGDGTFGRAASYRVGSDPTSVTLGDVNGDGGLDLAVANYRSNDVSILLGR